MAQWVNMKEAKKSESIILGVDLAGSPKRPTGVCVLDGNQACVSTVYEDDELLELVESHAPVLVPMDAPLTLPPGRKTLDDRNGEHLRPCDRALQQMGIRFFPITLGPMRMLTERGIQLKEQMDQMGFRAVECYPGGAQDVWGIPRKQHDLEGLLKGLRRLGLRGLRKTANDHELDAASGALAGRWFLEGRGTMLGDETGILMPVVDAG